MWRWIGQFVLAVSATCCVALLILCVRSYNVKDYIRYQRPLYHFSLTSEGGELYFHWQKFKRPILRYPLGWTYVRSSDPPLPLKVAALDPSFWQRRGFELAIGPLFDPRVNIRWVRVPDWLLFLAACAPLIWTGLRHFLRGRQIQSRIRRGQCARCGYDLRGSQSSRCPECGTVAGTAVAATIAVD